MKFEDLTPGNFAETSINGGLARLVRIWEKSRELNTGGYGSGNLVNVKGMLSATKAPTPTSCSPWTAAAISMAFDPNADDSFSATTYAPMFDGGSTPLPKAWCGLHNSWKLNLFAKNGAWLPYFKPWADKLPLLKGINFNSNASFAGGSAWDWINRSSGSVIAFNLGKPIDPKKMRRGDMVGLNWANNGGHAVFVWNVHLNANGDVDAFQLIAANSGVGVSISNNGGPEYSGLTKNSSGQFIKTKQDIFTKIIDDPQAYHEYTGWPYIWYGLNGVKKKDVDLASFGPKDPSHVLFYEAGTGYTVGSVNVSRLNGVTPPEPYLISGKSAPPSPPAPPTPVAKVQSKAPPAADSKSAAPAPTPAASGDAGKAPSSATPLAADPQAPQPYQLQVEEDLKAMYAARWISADPGDAGSVNDAASQAAIRDYQVKFMNSQAPSLGHADPDTRTRLCKAAAYARLMPLVNGYLQMLVKAGQLKTAPGTELMQLDDQTRASVKAFQSAHGLTADGVPGPQTQAKLAAVVALLPPEVPNPKVPAAPPPAMAAAAPDASTSTSASPAAAGWPPGILQLYWLGNHGDPGKNATLKVVVSPANDKQTFSVSLLSGTTPVVDNAGQVTIGNCAGSIDIAMPIVLAGGTAVTAKLTGNGIEASTKSPYTIDGGGSGNPPATTSADWRSYIGKDSVPDDVIATITKNRAVYPLKTQVTAGSGNKAPGKMVLLAKGQKYAGDLHFDYAPESAHQTWAKQYFAAKPNNAANRAFQGMLTHEGYPASFQTYDNQIVTWGAGLGAKGDGCHAFEQLNKTPAMKKFLDDIGINYEKHYWHVVDTAQKKVISSTTPPLKNGKPDGDALGNDNRHIPALEAWRRQMDLICAIIGLSEDANTRVAVGESQYAVFLSNSASWSGQDKITSDAVWFAISHLHAWMPAYTKSIDVAAEFAKLGASAPSTDTDAKIAPIVFNGFARTAAKYLLPKSPSTYQDVWTRARGNVWAAMRSDAKSKEGFDPGALTYDSDIPDGSGKKSS